MKAERVLPWCISAVVHAGILLVPLGVVLSSGPARASVTTVDITLSGPRQPLHASLPSRAESLTREAPPGSPAGNAAPESRTTTAEAVTENASARVPAEGGTQDAAMTSPIDSSAADQPAPVFSSDPLDPGFAAGQAALSPAAEGTPQIGWEGKTRALLRRRDPQFPAVLRAAGQEVEGEARITVSPSGAVLRVEITRSTGYIEIDASVEAALRDYLFSRVDGRGNAFGTVRFRFRLEKTD